MKNLKVCLCFVLAISLFTSSCTKDEELSKTELLTIEEGWFPESTTSNFQEIEDNLVDLFLLSLPEAERTAENEAAIREEVGFDISEGEGVEDCEKDDAIIFNRNKTLTGVHGAIKCDENEANQITTGTWSFNADETQLILTGFGGEVLEYNLKTLNSNLLELTLNDPITIFLELYDLTTIENIEGYDEFINSSFIITLTFKSN